MGVRGRLLSRPALHLFLLAVEAVEDAREGLGWDSLEESGALQSTLHCTGPLHSTLQQQPDPHAGYDRSIFTYFPPSGPGEQGRLYTEIQK